MKADIGRVTFEPAKHYARVVMQQGRVQVEADWNEQVSILLLAARQLAADLIGPWGGTPGAFEIQALEDARQDFQIGEGRYYVEGIACDNAGSRYRDQPYLPIDDDARLSRKDGAERGYLAYLDVWERLVTAAEDENIREVALGGPDTAARSQVVWQVRLVDVGDADMTDLDCRAMTDRWPELLALIEQPGRGRLRARAKATEAELDSPCSIDPRAAYRFDENALFRVEVHTPGPTGTATFKWSLDNGTVAFAIERFAGTRVALASLGRDARLTLQAGDHVELEDDAYVLNNSAEDLFVVESVDYAGLTVTLDRAPAPVTASLHPRLRRWDQQGGRQARLQADGTLPIVEESDPTDPWTALRHGVEIQFVAPSNDEPSNEYRTGDYWLIPARTATGDVLWPRDAGDAGATVPAARKPAGIEHHYAPLAHVVVASDGRVEVRQRFVRTIQPLAQCPPRDEE